MFEAQSRREELKARIALEEDRGFPGRRFAPRRGVIPDAPDRGAGRAAPGQRSGVLRRRGHANRNGRGRRSGGRRGTNPTGDRVALKLNPYPTMGFAGTVNRIGAQVREEDKERFVIAEVRVENPAGLLKTGMLGQAKISTGRVPVVVALLRNPLGTSGTSSGPPALSTAPGSRLVAASLVSTRGSARRRPAWPARRAPRPSRTSGSGGRCRWARSRGSSRTPRP